MKNIKNMNRIRDDSPSVQFLVCDIFCQTESVTLGPPHIKANSKPSGIRQYLDEFESRAHSLLQTSSRLEVALQT